MEEYIYALIDPRNHKIYYIGRTTDIEKRYATHLSLKDYSNMEKGKWIYELNKFGLKPRIVILEVSDIINAPMKERYWMDTGNWLGWPLLNFTDTEAKKANAKYQVSMLENRRRLAYEVAKRDGYSCAKCGYKPRDWKISILDVYHKIKPITLDDFHGATIDELHTLCDRCRTFSDKIFHSL